MFEQIHFDDFIKSPFFFDRKVRLIETFAGVGSQAMAMRDLGINFEHHRISEWETNAVASYKAIHMHDDNKDYSAGITKEELIDAIDRLCVSSDGKTPLTRDQIKRKGEKWLRQTFNNFNATHNVGSICNAHAKDFGITHKDRYIYVFCYSFPCTDLSVAGLMRGMDEGSGTSSSLLWEIKRILYELKETDALPQVLVMENVPGVHSQGNLKNWRKWMDVLNDLGYSTYYEDMNAKNFGIAQSRLRCIAVSILGDHVYHFPNPFPLKTCMKDYLEPVVDEHYYITNAKAKELIEKLIKGSVIPTQEDKIAGRAFYLASDIDGNTPTFSRSDNASTILARYDHGLQNFNQNVCIDLTTEHPGGVEVANCIKARYDDGISRRAKDGTGVCEYTRIDE